MCMYKGKKYFKKFLQNWYQIVGCLDRSSEGARRQTFIKDFAYVQNLVNSVIFSILVCLTNMQKVYKIVT